MNRYKHFHFAGLSNIFIFYLKFRISYVTMASVKGLCLLTDAWDTTGEADDP